METIETLAALRNATAEELMLRVKRASLVVLLADIKKLEKEYENKTGAKAPSLISLIKKHL